MRLAVALPGLEPGVGGGFTFVEEVARALALCTPPDGLELVILADAMLDGPIPSVPIRGESAIGRARRRVARSSQRLSRIVGGVSPVERAAREAGAHAVWLAAGGAEAIDLPFVATVWDVQHRTHPWFTEVSEHGLWQSRDLAARELLARAWLVVCGTRAGAEQLEFFYRVPRDRIVAAPHPTPGWALDPGPSDARGIPRSPYFLYPAQFWRHKNHASLIRALAHRRRDGSDAALVLVGGDYGIRDELAGLAMRLGVSERVHMPGFVPREVLRGYYEGAVALVVPAFSGPENLPPLEAMALGCPVANADFPGAREQLGDAAIYFDPIDPGSIASAMARLEQEPSLRSRLIERGFAIARDRRGERFVDQVLSAIADRKAWVDPFGA